MRRAGPRREKLTETYTDPQTDRRDCGTDFRRQRCWRVQKAEM